MSKPTPLPPDELEPPTASVTHCESWPARESQILIRVLGGLPERRSCATTVPSSVIPTRSSKRRAPLAPKPWLIWRTPPPPCRTKRLEPEPFSTPSNATTPESLIDGPVPRLVYVPLPSAGAVATTFRPLPLSSSWIVIVALSCFTSPPDALLSST